MKTEQCRTLLTPIVYNVAGLTNDNRFDELDDVYADIDFENTSVMECISYIRTAHQARNRLQQWYQLVDNSYHKAVLEYGEDRADRIFEGLR